MAEIVNLRQARKRKARDDDARRAEENRIRYGCTKAERQRGRLEQDTARALLDGHRREPADDRE